MTFSTNNTIPSPSLLKINNSKVINTNTITRSLASIPVGSNEAYAEPSSPSSPPPPGKNPLPDFNDAKSAYETKKTAVLFRSMLSFGLCQVPILVRHSEFLLKLSRKILGDTIIDVGLKQTLFGHFCAGEDAERIQPAIRSLQVSGIGSILDFAAEDDGGDEDKAVQATTVADVIVEDNLPKVRVYDYESECKCDRHVATFKQCIKAVSDLQPDGYAAIKVTALGNPILLERMSRAIIEAQNLFAKFDVNGDGTIGREEFEHGFELFFRVDDDKLKRMLAQISSDADGNVDYITWSMMLTPRDLPRITRGCKDVGPLALAAPTDEEVDLIEKMYARGHALAKEAAACGTRLLIDAEQARFQPAIDNLVLELQRTYNAKSVSDKPIIYNTYQCYLKDVADRLPTDVERSERFCYHFGAKLVRGAYMESERALAESLGVPSPIHDTLQDTHDCYNDSVDFLLAHSVQSDKNVEVMVASHNQESIEKAIASMNKHGVDRKDAVICFAQLYGMADNLSYNMGKHGYRAYKYVPYGEVKMVVSFHCLSVRLLYLSVTIYLYSLYPPTPLDTQITVDALPHSTSERKQFACWWCGQGTVHDSRRGNPQNETQIEIDGIGLSIICKHTNLILILLLPATVPKRDKLKSIRAQLISYK